MHKPRSLLVIGAIASAFAAAGPAALYAGSAQASAPKCKLALVLKQSGPGGTNLTAVVHDSSSGSCTIPSLFAGAKALNREHKLIPLTSGYAGTTAKPTSLKISRAHPVSTVISYYLQGRQDGHPTCERAWSMAFKLAGYGTLTAALGQPLDVCQGPEPALGYKRLH
jgi:hypothetical protein